MTVILKGKSGRYELIEEKVKSVRVKDGEIKIRYEDGAYGCVKGVEYPCDEVEVASVVPDEPMTGRLTKWNGKKWVLPQGRTADGESYFRIIAERLAAYENTGMTPEEIETMKKHGNV